MSPRAFLFFCAFGAVALAAVLGVLLAGKGRVGAPRVALAAALGLALAALFGFGPDHDALDYFGRLQLLWILLAFVAPAAGAAVLAARARGRTVSNAATLCASLGLLAALVALYAMAVEPRRLQLETAELTARAHISGPLRIGVVSDLQCSRVTAHERRAVRWLMAERPDLILIAGDVFQGTRAHFERCRADYAELLSGLAAPGGVWLVRGDVDGGEEFEELALAAGIPVLRDASALTRVRGIPIEIFGVDRWTNDRAALLGFLARERPAGAARLVLAHRPDPALGLARDLGAPVDLDLFVAGHTHGGQVQLPLYGPPITLSRVPRSVGAGGLHELDGVPVYVARGVGIERQHAPRVRFLCPPEVAVVTLHPGAERPEKLRGPGAGMR